jgi:acylphosphatase
VKSVHILISGRVHGVGFRYFALHKANEINILGWVKNTPDVKVEIEASGETKDLDIFIDWMRIGPTRAVVQNCSVSEITPHRYFTSFTIR